MSDEKGSAPLGVAPRDVLEVRLLAEEKAAVLPPDPAQTRRRWLLFAMLVGLAVACGYSLFWIGDHPIRTLATSLGAAITLVLGIAPAAFGTRPTSTSAWGLAAFDALVGWAAKGKRSTAVVSISLAWMSWAALHFGSGAMSDAELVACPPGVTLEYGTLGARIDCVGEHDRVWTPFGLEREAPTFRCVSTETGASWPPFRRPSRYPRATVHDERFSDARFSCYEDGSEVVASSDCAGESGLVFLEYGWATSALARELVAPCDHESTGVYRLVGEDQRSCHLVSASACPADTCSRSCPAPCTREISAECVEACSDVMPELGEELDRSSPAVLDWLAGLGATGHRWAHPRRPGQFKLNEISLVLEGRELSFPVGVSYRGSRRCVPAEERRDGFLHVFERDRETVLALREAGGFCLVETSYAMRPPPGVAGACPRTE